VLVVRDPAGKRSYVPGWMLQPAAAQMRIKSRTPRVALGAPSGRPHTVAGACPEH
jgi:hypothetical protein